MEDRTADERRARATGAPASSAGASSHESPPKDHFLKLMFFQASHGEVDTRDEPPALMTGAYAPLRHSIARPGVRYALPSSNAAGTVRLDSPATDVMTDLRRVEAVTIDRDASIGTANRVMINRAVRALFVVDDNRQVLGLITASDVLGERPIQFAQSRNIRHSEVAVRDIMTPADRLEVLDLREVLRARVGDMIATLRLTGRQHALAVEPGEGPAPEMLVRGIFSLTQIARNLGIPPQQTHDIAGTFAEIEAVIAGD